MNAIRVLIYLFFLLFLSFSYMHYAYCACTYFSGIHILKSLAVNQKRLFIIALRYESLSVDPY